MITRRGEKSPSMPLKLGHCDWCGAKVKPGKTYCNDACRTAYNNLIARQGKRVMQRLKLWRKYRGRKGTRGAGVIGEIATIVDETLEEDRKRHEENSKNETGKVG